MNTRAKTLAACRESAVKGLYAAVLPDRAPTLRTLWITAAEASEALSAAYAAAVGIPDDQFDEIEEELCRREDEAGAAKLALFDHLLNEHGLTTADIKRWPL